ncbi:hypothetical protein D3C78_1184950 [compost metagenome]
MVAAFGVQWNVITHLTRQCCGPGTATQHDAIGAPAFPFGAAQVQAVTLALHGGDRRLMHCAFGDQWRGQRFDEGARVIHVRRLGKQNAADRLARQRRLQLFDIRRVQHLLGNAQGAAQFDRRSRTSQTLLGAVGIDATVVTQMPVGQRSVGQQRRIAAVGVLENPAQGLGVGLTARSATFIEKPQ